MVNLTFLYDDRDEADQPAAPNTDPHDPDWKDLYAGGGMPTDAYSRASGLVDDLVDEFPPADEDQDEVHVWGNLVDVLATHIDECRERIYNLGGNDDIGRCKAHAQIADILKAACREIHKIKVGA